MDECIIHIYICTVYNTYLYIVCTYPAKSECPKSLTGCVCVFDEQSFMRPVVLASISLSSRLNSSRL